MASRLSATRWHRSCPDALVRTLLCLVLVAFTPLVRGEMAAKPSAEFPFEYREGMLWLQVNVPHYRPPLHFLLDSGAQVSVINLEIARHLELPLGRKVRVRGVHTSMTGYWPQTLCATAGGVALPSRLLALNLSKLSGACEQPVDGLIGADFFQGRIVQIDFAARRIRLLDWVRLRGAGISLPLELGSGGMCVSASVNGSEPQWFRVDTGCATPLQWVTCRTPPEPYNSKVAIGLAELNIPQRRAALTLGGHTFRRVPTGIHRKAIFPGEAGLLGAKLLARFETVTFDAPRGKLVLGPLRDSQ